MKNYNGIITEKRAETWIAHLDWDKRVHESGKTEDEVIGKLWISASDQIIDYFQGHTDKEYTDEQTSVRLIVEQNNPGFPGHPKLTITCPVQHILSLEEINEAMDRLQSRAGISPQHRMSPLNRESDRL